MSLLSKTTYTDAAKVRAAIADGADVHHDTHRGDCPLSTAYYSGELGMANVAIIEQLLDAGVDPDSVHVNAAATPEEAGAVTLLHGVIAEDNCFSPKHRHRLLHTLVTAGAR